MRWIGADTQESWQNSVKEIRQILLSLNYNMILTNGSSSPDHIDHNSMHKLTGNYLLHFGSMKHEPACPRKHLRKININGISSHDDSEINFTVVIPRNIILGWIFHHHVRYSSDWAQELHNIGWNLFPIDLTLIKKEITSYLLLFFNHIFPFHCIFIKINVLL